MSRRRQIFAQKALAEKVSHETFDGKPSETQRGKGHCEKCGKYIGRGIAFHRKKCNGN